MPPESPSPPESLSSWPSPDPPSNRLAYLVSRYPALSHSFILREIRELRRLGVEVHVLSILTPDRAPEALSPEERAEFHSTYYVRANWPSWPAAHLATLLTRPVDYLAGLFLAVRSAAGDPARAIRHLRFFGESVAAGRRLRQLRLDRIHTHFASLTAMLAKRVFGFRLSLTIHGSDEFIDPAGFCMRQKLHHASLAIGISRYGCSQIMRFSDPRDWDKVRMVRLGIDLDAFRPVPRAVAAGPFRVLCVGRLVPVKAYRFLIRACAQLIGEGESIHLTIAGGGPERDQLSSFVRSIHLGGHVEFTGPLSMDRVRDRLAQCGCFALASFAEGVPVVLMEAMALEVPCIATRVTGIPELIADGVEGLLVPPADVDSLAAAIRRLAHDPELRRQLAAAGRAKVVRDYDLLANIRELRDCLFANTSE